MSRELFRKKALPQILKIGKTKADELTKDPEFPRLFPLSDDGRAKFGFMDELDAFLEARATKAKRGGERDKTEQTR